MIEKLIILACVIALVGALIIVIEVGFRTISAEENRTLQTEVNRLRACQQYDANHINKLLKKLGKDSRVYVPFYEQQGFLDKAEKLVKQSENGLANTRDWWISVNELREIIESLKEE